MRLKRMQKQEYPKCQTVVVHAVILGLVCGTILRAVSECLKCNV